MKLQVNLSKQSLSDLNKYTKQIIDMMPLYITQGVEMSLKVLGNISATKYMIRTSAKKGTVFQAVDPIRLTWRYGRLARALMLREGKDGIEGATTIQIEKSNIRGTLGIKTPYAKIHEFGGQVNITEKMRKFFWAKYYEATKNEYKFHKRRNTKRQQFHYEESNYWKNFALIKGNTMRIKPRPFLSPTLQDENLHKGINNIFREQIREMIKKVKE